ncbi:hypothetical protein [Anaerotignum sp.]
MNCMKKLLLWVSDILKQKETKVQDSLKDNSEKIPDVKELGYDAEIYHKMDGYILIQCMISGIYVN